MRKEIVFSRKGYCQNDLPVFGYHFGKGELSACIVGALRGNEIQQLYVCSQLVKKLKELEERGAIVSNNEILVIPSADPAAINIETNIETRFRAVEDRDMNPMFPGREQDETGQGIAAGLFEVVKRYSYGIQFTGCYMEGDWIPHVSMMENGGLPPSLANLFGLPYVVIRKPRTCDCDAAALNFNGQNWNSSVFSLYTHAADRIDEEAARQAVASVLRFLTRMGMIRYISHSGYNASVIREDDLMNVITDKAGICRQLARPGVEVHRGEVLAEILDPYEGEVTSRILSPTDGIVFFAHNAPLEPEGAVAFKIIRRLHE